MALTPQQLINIEMQFAKTASAPLCMYLVTL